MNRIFVANRSEMLEGRPKKVRVGKIDVTVFFHKERFYAFKDLCPHAGHSLSSGRIFDDKLVCPGHNWHFELESGQCVKGDTSIVLKSFKTVVEDGKVFVEVE